VKSLIEILVKALVDKPDAVDVREVTDRRSVTYEVSVDPEDLGKIIRKVMDRS